MDECDRLPFRLPNPEVPPGPSRSPEDVQVDEVVTLLVRAYHVSRRVLAVRVDDDHLDRRLLDHEAVQQGSDVPLLVANRGDDTDEQRGSYSTSGNDAVYFHPRGTIFNNGRRVLPRT